MNEKIGLIYVYHQAVRPARYNGQLAIEGGSPLPMVWFTALEEVRSNKDGVNSHYYVLLDSSGNTIMFVDHVSEESLKRLKDTGGYTLLIIENGE